MGTYLMGLFKSKNITTAKKTADRWFNKYIRLRDADEDGYVECITCGSKNHLSENKTDAGHFVESDRLSVRYDEWNVHGQCKSCNLSASGKQYQMGKAINLKHGSFVADELIESAKDNLSYTKEELMELARKYKLMCEELENTKFNKPI